MLRSWRDCFWGVIVGDEGGGDGAFFNEGFSGEGGELLELFVRGWAGGGGERGNELAGGEVFEGLEAAGEFFGSEAAVAIESAEKIGSGARAFFRIAMHTAGDEVAVGIAPGLDLGHDMVDALNARVGAAQAIK